MSSSRSADYAWQALADHFGAEHVNLIASSRRQFGVHLLPDLQSTITTQFAPFDAPLIGVHTTDGYEALTISGLLIRSEKDRVAIAPLQYQDMDIGEDEPFAALNNGLWLFHAEGRPIAVLLSQFCEFRETRFAQIEIATLSDPASTTFSRAFLKSLQEAGANSTLYRGKVLSFDAESDYSGMRSAMLVHKLPRVSREAVVLDAGTMAKLDRHVFDFDRHRAGLRRLGQSTRKGVLLYGPPGTGKTHVIRYIASNLPHRTTILITAEQIRDLGKYILLARTLQPSIVVLEDVDLVGRLRESLRSPDAEILLNRLLNEMDGLREDADILFILTTNRPEQIEEALASRPGRVDEAVEIANPDSACRERLAMLYGASLDFEEGAIAEIVSRSQGASAAFVKEMVRRLAQATLAADGGDRVSTASVKAIFGDVANGTRPTGRRIIGFVT